MPLPLAAIGAGIGLIGGIGKMFGRGKSNRELSKLMKQNPVYQENPIAKQRLALAQTLLNARTPGAVQAERNIYSNQASQIANVNRLASDAGQALSLSSGVGEGTNMAFNQLAMNEAQDYQRRYGNLAGAQEGMIREGDKVFNDKIRRFNDTLSIKGAQNANRQNSWGDISNMGFGLAQFGLAGGFDFGIGGGGQGISGDMLYRNPIQPTPLGGINSGTSPAQSIHI